MMAEQSTKLRGHSCEAHDSNDNYASLIELLSKVLGLQS